MPKIIVDIAGFYYHREVQVAENATVRDAMIAASDADRADRLAGGTKAVLDFAEDFKTTPFLRSITVHHLEPPVSRQNDKREYPKGEYTFRSDSVALSDPDDDNSAFIGVDLDGVPTGRPYVLVWQYYVYDENVVDTSRRAKGVGGELVNRRIVPFSTLDESNRLVEGGQIVWRTIGIFLSPTRTPSIKSTPSVDRISTVR